MRRECVGASGAGTSSCRRRALAGQGPRIRCLTPPPLALLPHCSHSPAPHIPPLTPAHPHTSSPPLPLHRRFLFPSTQHTHSLPPLLNIKSNSFPSPSLILSLKSNSQTHHPQHQKNSNPPSQTPSLNCEIKTKKTASQVQFVLRKPLIWRDSPLVSRLRKREERVMFLARETSSWCHRSRSQYHSRYASPS